MTTSADLIGRFASDLLAQTPDTRGRLGIGLSGGPDSLALLVLAEKAFPGRVAAATVDHGLRPESRAEAALAARACASLGVPHRILDVEVERRASLQASAREARYAALAAWMEEEEIPVLLTAHHADDQAETLIMRLLRGSGAGGLAGVRPRRPFGPGLLCRPLLGWRRSELAAVVAAAGLEAADDPSNRDEAYDRARLRKALAAADWIDPAALARSAAALAEAEDALEAWADRLEAERIGSVPGNLVTLDPGGIPPEMVRRLLLRALRRIDGAAAPRGEQLGALAAALEAGRSATLARVKCSGGAVWRFERAPPRLTG